MICTIILFLSFPLPSFISVSARAGTPTLICVSAKLRLFIRYADKKQRVGHRGERTNVPGEEVVSDAQQQD